MRIVSDCSVDLDASIIKELEIELVPLTTMLEGVSYRSDENIDLDWFYTRIIESGQVPKTSQPSPALFASAYERIAQEDPEILSLHVSSGLSGTINSARIGAENVPDANITVYDTRTLSLGVGWQVEAAAQAVRAGWSYAEIMRLVSRVGEATRVLCLLGDLKYLSMGGRLGNLPGLIASVLHIRPTIGVDLSTGKFALKRISRTIAHAIEAVPDIIREDYAPDICLRVQTLHTMYPQGARQLLEKVKAEFNCNCLSIGRMGLVLGSHAGPVAFGIAYAPQSIWDDLPWEKPFCKEE